MEKYEAFIRLIEEFIQLFEMLIPVEQKKLEAALENKVSFVEECVNKEQAAVLRLRGLEQKRECEQKKLGMEDYTFRQMLAEVPPDVVPVLQPLFDKLTEQMRTFKSVNDSAKDIIEVNLHKIQASLASSGTENSYSSSGRKKSDGSKHFTSLSV